MVGWGWGVNYQIGLLFVIGLPVANYVPLNTRNYVATIDYEKRAIVIPSYNISVYVYICPVVRSRDCEHAIAGNVAEMEEGGR